MIARRLASIFASQYAGAEELALRAARPPP